MDFPGSPVVKIPCFHCRVLVQLLSRVQLFATPWTAACQASLFFTISVSLVKLICIELVMPSNHLILCCPLLLPSIFPSIRVFSNEPALHIKWPRYFVGHFKPQPSSSCQPEYCNTYCLEHHLMRKSKMKQS